MCIVVFYGPTHPTSAIDICHTNCLSVGDIHDLISFNVLDTSNFSNPDLPYKSICLVSNAELK